MFGTSGSYVMEATDCYHQLMAIYLYDLGVLVSVVNPLTIKRFIQMKLQNLKTDKNDLSLWRRTSFRAIESTI